MCLRLAQDDPFVVDGGMSSRRQSPSSEEGDATSIDLRRVGRQAPAPQVGSRDASDADVEATEFLQRQPVARLRAQGRAVPIEDGDPSDEAPNKRSPAYMQEVVRSVRDERLPTQPLLLNPLADDDRTQEPSRRVVITAATPMPIGADSADEPSATSPKAIAQSSMPRVTRIVLNRGDSSTGPQKVAHVDGVLVVDVPAEAQVWVNGIERGRGAQRITDLDRDAKHAVRVACSGFVPWNGVVSLEGKPAAKLKPQLKPRAR
jgi:hypothetical protein